MNKTLVTYKQASEILNGKYPTIAAAVDRGVFTRVPVVQAEQKIVKEQVELFIGKKQLKLSALNRAERTIWEEIEASVKNTDVSIDTSMPLSPNIEAFLNEFEIRAANPTTQKKLASIMMKAISSGMSQVDPFQLSKG